MMIYMLGEIWKEKKNQHALVIYFNCIEFVQ